MSRHGAALVPMGPTSLRVSALGVGTNSWGSPGGADPGKQATYDTLLSNGINLFDTAEIYTGGASERTIGRCIAATEVTPVVITKFFPFPWRVHRQDLIAALKRSLARLALPSVDLYLLHFPLPPVALETWMNALADAMHAGLARAVGVSNCNVAQTRRAHAALAARGVPLACNEVELSLLKRGPEHSGLLSACRDLGVTLIAYRPLAQGILTGKYSPESPPRGMRFLFQGRRALAGAQPLVAELRRIAGKRGKTPSQVALNWVICKGALPIPGARDQRQAEENAGALGWRLTEDEIGELEAACP